MIDLSKYIGIPFDRLDCWQLVCLFYARELGIKLPDFKGEYRHASDAENTVRLYAREAARKVWPKVETPQPYDICAFLINGEEPHVGIYLWPNEMLHTQKDCRSIIEDFKSLRWKNRFKCFYRYAEKN